MSSVAKSTRGVLSNSRGRKSLASIGLAVAAAGMLALATGGARAAVLYSQDFDVNNTGVTATAWSTVNWDLRYGATASSVTVSTGGNPRSGLTGDTAAPSDNNNVNATDGGNARGRSFFVPASADGANNRAIAYSTEYQQIDSSNVTSVTWYQRNDNASDFDRAVLQVGGNWYASSAPTQGTANGSGWTLDTVTLSTATWVGLNFTPGTALDQTLSNTTVALPAGTITGFGVYQAPVAGSTDGTRIDGFVINGTVPEPTSAGALAVAAGGLRLLGRRRRTRDDRPR